MFVSDENAMRSLGRKVAGAGESAGVIYLEGELGAGKTTFARGVIQQFGITSRVKSPTYTLVEPYTIREIRIYHFDFYRLGDPEELEYIGARDYFAEGALCLIEWPERGQPLVPPADLTVRISFESIGRRVEFLPSNQLGTRFASIALRAS